MNRLSLKMIATTAMAAATILPSQAGAWGTIGHKTVAEIAYQNLQPATRTRVAQLLGGKTMVSVSTWADSIREKSEWSHTAWYHFEKIYDGKTYLENLKSLPQDQQDLGGVVMALLQSEKVFIDKNSSEAQKSDALKFVIHFVGDIHQPLHTGRPEDKGGNMIPRVWNGFQTNLHAIWDTQIIETGHGDIFSIAIAAPKEKIYAPYLEEKFKNVTLSARQLTDVNVWVDESLAMRPDAYKYMDEDEDQYTKRFVNAVDSRVYLAGIRLAGMLNQMVLKEQPPTARVQFVTAIEKIVGKLTGIICLTPRALPGDEGDQSDDGSGTGFY